METVQRGPMTYDGGFPGLKTNMDPKERFYRHFETQATALQEEIANLGDIAASGGERKDATDHVLGGISRLTSEVSDASEFAPPRDQMIYGQALKALREQLNIQARTLGPESRFQFSQESKDAFISATRQGVPATETDTAAQAEMADALGKLPDLANHSSISSSSGGARAKDYNAEMAREPGTGIRKPSFSGASEIDISGHEGMHIILPPTARRATSSGSVTGLRGCVLDMSARGSTAAAATAAAAPFASLTIRDVAGSLVVAGRVAGAAHVTGVRDSVLAVSARQVRMHECHNVTVYLWCASHPIIEDCTAVRFAPLPAGALDGGGGGGGEAGDPAADDGNDNNNKWDQVDDFNWLKAEASPNWERLSGDGGSSSSSSSSILPADFWTDTVKGGAALSTGDILARAGIR